MASAEVCAITFLEGERGGEGEGSSRWPRAVIKTDEGGMSGRTGRLDAAAARADELSSAKVVMRLRVEMRKKTWSFRSIGATHVKGNNIQVKALNSHLMQFLARLAPISFSWAMENGIGPFIKAAIDFPVVLLMLIALSIFFCERPFEAAAAAHATAKRFWSRPREGIKISNELAVPMDHM
jgi:hypothetical protein